MAITASGKKSARQSHTRRVFNLRRLRTMKATVKDARENTDAKNVQEKLSAAYKAIDKAAKRGIVKKNTAARQKSKLAKAVAQK